MQDTCLKECLLTHQPLLHILSKILMVCLTFTTYVHDVIHDKMMMTAQDIGGDPSVMGSGDRDTFLLPNPSRGQGSSVRSHTNTARWSRSTSKRGSQHHRDRRVRVEAQSEALNQEVLSQAFGCHVANFARRFDEHMRDFMHCLMRDSQAQYHSHLTNLCTRMEYWRPTGGVTLLDTTS